jgi:hypothetical protein
MISVQVVLYVIIFFFLILAGIGVSLLSIFLYKPRTEDRIDLCLALVDNGTKTTPVNGKMISSTNKGVQYQLNNGLLVIVPFDYGVNYVKHRRKIDIKPNGDLIYKVASTFTQSEYEGLRKEITLSKIGADIVRAVSGGGNSIGMIILVAIIALVLGVGGTMIVSKQTTKPIQQATIQTTPSQNKTGNITLGK